MKYLLYPITFILLNSCNYNSEKPLNKENSDTTSNELNRKDPALSTSIDTTDVKNWLKNTIENYFNEENIEMKSITTDQYYNFKMDAMNVDLDTEKSLTIEEFNKKWRESYDLITHPIQTGFLISGQDWGKIIVNEIKLMEDNKTSLIFHINIHDEDFKMNYDRQIKVVGLHDKYLIDDIVEKN